MSKNLKLLIAIMLLACSGAFAQFSHKTTRFDSLFIIPSDLIIEGTIIQKTYFKDTSIAVRKFKFIPKSSDSDGVWFVQYQVLVHKIFKGQCKTSTVTFVEPNYDYYMYINGNRIRSQFYTSSYDYYKSNYYPRTTGVFFLKTSIS